MCIRDSRRTILRQYHPLRSGHRQKRRILAYTTTINAERGWADSNVDASTAGDLREIQGLLIRVQWCHRANSLHHRLQAWPCDWHWRPWSAQVTSQNLKCTKNKGLTHRNRCVWVLSVTKLWHQNRFSENPLTERLFDNVIVIRAGHLVVALLTTEYWSRMCRRYGRLEHNSIFRSLAAVISNSHRQSSSILTGIGLLCRWFFCCSSTEFFWKHFQSAH